MSTEDLSRSPDRKPRGKRAREAVRRQSGKAQSFHETSAENGGSKQKKGHNLVLERLGIKGFKANTKGGSRSNRHHY